MSVNANVIIYTTGYCGFCARAKMLLSKKNVNFTEIDVEERPDLRAWLIKASGQRTVPQIFINGTSIGGFSELSALEREGTLNSLLSESPAADRPELPS